MSRRLSAEEKALWRKVAGTVRPLAGAVLPEPDFETETEIARPPRRPIAASTAPPPPRAPGDTLDSSWDRRLSRGLVRPDLVVDLHGHSLAGAHHLLERELERGVADGSRLMLLVTGKPPRGEERPFARGAIRASVGDWLASSPQAGAIAAIRSAHPRHGGAGALYIVLRRRCSAGT